MKRLTVLIDMDDVIECLMDGWVSWLNARYNTDVESKSVRLWDVTRYFPGLTTEQIYEPFLLDDFWDWVKPKPDAPEYVKKLIDDGHNVYIVTASTYETLPAKMDRVLFRYFPYLTFDNVIVTSNKQMVKGDVLIDDGIHNLVGGDYMKLLMDAPHNQGIDVEDFDIRRVYDWKGIYAILTRMANS